MTYKTHLVGGAVAAMLLTLAASEQELGLKPFTTPEFFGVLTASLLGSLAPDIDQGKKSKAGAMVKPVASVCSKCFGHRTFCHGGRHRFLVCTTGGHQQHSAEGIPIRLVGVIGLLIIFKPGSVGGLARLRNGAQDLIPPVLHRRLDLSRGHFFLVISRFPIRGDAVEGVSVFLRPLLNNGFPVVRIVPGRRDADPVLFSQLENCCSAVGGGKRIYLQPDHAGWGTRRQRGGSCPRPRFRRRWRTGGIRFLSRRFSARAGPPPTPRPGLENNEKPCYTDKPDWDAFGAMLLGGRLSYIRGTGASHRGKKFCPKHLLQTEATGLTITPAFSFPSS